MERRTFRGGGGIPPGPSSAGDAPPDCQCNMICLVPSTRPAGYATRFGRHEGDAFQIAHQQHGKCDCRSAKSGPPQTRNSQLITQSLSLRGLIGDSALDVVAGKVAAEDRPSVRVGLFRS
jgi:hypothetical protein